MAVTPAASYVVFGAVSDNPVINSPATASVAENQLSAIDVQATDNTDSEGAGLVFTLSGGADQSLFNIDTNSGVVTFITAPDFETPDDAGTDNNYDFQVTVTDSDGLTAVQDIIITVTDVVETTGPTITSSNTASVPENQTSAIDVDATDNSNSEGPSLIYSISGGADAALFTIDDESGVVTFNSAPDFENPGDAGADNNYDIQVTVSDIDEMTAVQDIIITVTDVVENSAPTITSANSTSVPENQSSAIDVDTTDDLDSEGAGLTYSLTGITDDALFDIDPATGVVTFMTVPDFETPTDTGTDNTYDFQVTVTDSDGLTDVQDIVITVTDVNENTGPMTLDVSVSTSSDDAEENAANGNVNRGSSDLELVDQGALFQIVGIRFNGLNIPRGATITTAYLQFHADETHSGITNLMIEGQAIDNAPTFTDTNSNISSRDRTNAVVDWDPAPWTTVGAAGPDQQTPDIASIVQEIVDRQGWSSDNSLAMIITGSGRRTAESYNGDPDQAPSLHVEYTQGTGDNQAPNVNAGSNQTVNLPSGASTVDVSLNATVNDDGLPTPSERHHHLESGKRTGHCQLC